MYELITLSIIVCLLSSRASLGVAGNAHRHHGGSAQHHSDSHLSYLDMVILQNADAICGIGCYTVHRDEISGREISDIFKVDVQFMDLGYQSNRHNYANDKFMVYRKYIADQHPTTLMSEFSVGSWEFYRQRLRATQISSDFLNWLRNTTDDQFFLKFKKYGDFNNYRFVYNPEAPPSLILYSHTGVRQPASRVQRSVRSQICPDDNVDINNCCLLPRRVSNERRGPALSFIDLPDNFSVTICVGRCRLNPLASTRLQDTIGGSVTKCCRRSDGAIGYVTLNYTDGNGRREERFGVHATECECI